MSSGRPETEAARRRARRDVARRLHPDVGGDPDEFVAALAAIDEWERGPQTLLFQTRDDRLTKARRRMRSVVRRTRPVRRLRARLPRSVPGSRRWIDL